MYEENNSYEEVLERTLARVSTDVDKREGSVVFNGIAPTSEEIAFVYTLLDEILDNGFIDTAERDYVILRCKERGITPYPATNAVLKSEFNMEIPIGNRFNLGDLNYVIIQFIEALEGKYYYQIQCETAGTEGNVQFGELSAIDFVDTNMEGSIIELLIPAEDEESTEALVEDYYNSFTTTPFGGNQDDYKKAVNGIAGVGGVKIIPVWNGGGTVKLIIISSTYTVASSVLVATVQNEIDPTPQGTGVGKAPIGHTVTVVSCDAKTASISFRCTLDEGYSWDGIKDTVVLALEEYFLEVRKNWDTSNASVVRISQVENRVLNVDGVLDVQNTKINGAEENLVLEFSEIPLLGGVTNVG